MGKFNLAGSSNEDISGGGGDDSDISHRYRGPSSSINRSSNGIAAAAAIARTSYNEVEQGSPSHQPELLYSDEPMHRGSCGISPSSPMARMMDKSVQKDIASNAVHLPFQPPLDGDGPQHSTTNSNNNNNNSHRYAPKRAPHQPPQSVKDYDNSPIAGKQRSSSFDTRLMTAPVSPRMIRRKSSFCKDELHATIVFLDLEGYSKSSDVHQRRLTSDFMSTLRNLLSFAYGYIPSRENIDNYVILPTGDGAAVIVIKPPKREIKATATSRDSKSYSYDNSDDGSHCRHNDNCGENGECATQRSSNGENSECSIRNNDNDAPSRGIKCEYCSCQSLRTTEETALWIGSTLLLWASQRQIGLRVGLNSGELSIVEDPYGDPNVCGDAINMAARIMDTALPGQILASASTVVPNLNSLLESDRLELEGSSKVYAGGVDELDSGRDYGKMNSGDNMRRRKKDCSRCPRVKCVISQAPSEVVVKHGVTTNVQSITCTLYQLPRPEDLPQELEEGITPSTTTGEDEKSGQPNQLSQLNPLMKKKPQNMSFASLSSALQGGGSSHSLRGSFRASTMDSHSDNKSGDTSNMTWDSSEITKAAQQRMSVLSQLSADDNNNEINKALINGYQQPASTQQLCLPQQVGNHKTPATKWYMKIKPTEMQSSGGEVKPKVLPQELIRRHQRIAFLGIMHDNLSKGFIKILESDPKHRWDQVYVLFPSDSCLKNHLAKNYRDQPVEKLIFNKQECRKTLLKLLSPVVDNLRFLQYDQLMHCGSYWDWKEPGGFIHISPLTWGANPKTCPAMNYYWNSRVPSPEYRVYREGLEYLLNNAKPFDDIIDTTLEFAGDTIDEEEA